MVWTPYKPPARQVAVGLVRFGDAAGARAYQGLAIDLQRKQDEVLGNPRGGAYRVLESRCSNVTLPGTDEAIRSDKRLQPAGGGEPRQLSTLLVRSGSLVIEFSWHGLPADPVWAERVLAALLAGGPPP